MGLHTDAGAHTHTYTYVLYIGRVYWKSYNKTLLLETHRFEGTDEMTRCVGVFPDRMFFKTSYEPFYYYYFIIQE